VTPVGGSRSPALGALLRSATAHPNSSQSSSAVPEPFAEADEAGERGDDEDR
jgi:hypothetical protein